VVPLPDFVHRGFQLTHLAAITSLVLAGGTCGLCAEGRWHLLALNSLGVTMHVRVVVQSFAVPGHLEHNVRKLVVRERGLHFPIEVKEFVLLVLT